MCVLHKKAGVLKFSLCNPTCLSLVVRKEETDVQFLTGKRRSPSRGILLPEKSRYGNKRDETNS